MSERIRLVALTLVVVSLLVAGLLAQAGDALGAQLRRARTSHAQRARTSHAVARRAVALADKQARVVTFARRFLGVRYVYGGVSPRTGFDCSGFTRFIYLHFGIALPHYSGAQFARGHRVSRAGLRPGDLVFFDGLGHVGMYIGGGRFIHAPHSGTSVSVASLNGWYGARYDGARRLF